MCLHIVCVMARRKYEKEPTQNGRNRLAWGSVCHHIDTLLKRAGAPTVRYRLWNGNPIADSQGKKEFPPRGATS